MKNTNKHKKALWLKVIIATVAITAMALSMTACDTGGNNQTDCQRGLHEWNAYVQTIDPTCTDAGIKTRTCKNCTVVDTVTETGEAALGHGLWVYRDGAIPATCAAPGNGSRDCGRGRCDFFELNITFAIDPDAHDWDFEEDEDWYPTTAAECETDGLETRTCRHTDCPVGTETRTLDALNHQWTTISGIPSTCTTHGSGRRQCDLCEKIEDTDQLGLDPTVHLFVEDKWTLDTTPATCTTPATDTQKCDYDSCDALHPTNTREGRAALDHNMIDDGVETAATCLATGIMNTKCDRDGCEHTDTRVIAINPNNHTAECDAANRNIYTITGSGTAATARRGLCVTVGTGEIQTVINAVRSHTTGRAATIQFGSGGTDTLAITTSTIWFDNGGGTWTSPITLTGRISGTVAIANTGTIHIQHNISINSTAVITNTVSNADARAIYNNSTGTLNINSGTISASSGQAIHSIGAGKINISGTAIVTSGNGTDTAGTIVIAGTSTGDRLEITGGTVRNSATGNVSRAINNQSNGRVIISGGDVTAAGVGRAIHNNASGTINISGGTVSTTGTGQAIQNNGSGTINISGGTVSVSATTGAGQAIHNNGSGIVNISDGTVSAINGQAIHNASNGRINVSGMAMVTSQNVNANLGTIVLADSGDGVAERLVITGGTVQNTANNANSRTIRNLSTGAVHILGGTVTAGINELSFTVEGFRATNPSALILGGDPVISGGGGLRVAAGRLTLSTGSPAPAFNPDPARRYVLNFAPVDFETIPFTAVTNGAAFLDRFILGGSDYNLAVNGGAIEVRGCYGGDHLASCDLSVYVINGSNGEFTVSKGLCTTLGIPNQPIQTVINSIRDDAAGSPVTIQFGLGTEPLNIGPTAASATLSFNGDWGTEPITLVGGITGNNNTDTAGTIVLAGNVSITSSANISVTTAANGRAINNTGTGTVTITGGRVSTVTGNAIRNSAGGALYIKGGTVISTGAATSGTAIWNAAGGNITISGDIWNEEEQTGTRISAGNQSASHGAIVLALGSTGTLEITGGTIENNNSAHSNSRAINNLSNSAAVIIRDGLLRTTVGSANVVFNSAGGTVTIYGGTISSLSGSVVNSGSGRVTIYGGTISSFTTGRAVMRSGTGTVTIHQPPTMLFTGVVGTTYETAEATNKDRTGTTTGTITWVGEN
jgi:hypothetical protein